MKNLRKKTMIPWEQIAQAIIVIYYITEIGRNIFN